MRNNKNICILPFISMDRNPYTEGLPAGPCCMYQQQEEKVYDYELIHFGHNFADAMQRKYRMFRFTEAEANEMNKQYIYNNTKKRLVRVSGRFNNDE